MEQEPTTFQAATWLPLCRSGNQRLQNSRLESSGTKDKNGYELKYEVGPPLRDTKAVSGFLIVYFYFVLFFFINHKYEVAFFSLRHTRTLKSHIHVFLK